MAMLDIVVFLLLGGFGIRGFMSGFVKESLSLCAVIAGVLAVRFFHAPVADFASAFLGTDYISALLALIFVFGVVYVSVRLVASTLSSQVKNVGLGSIDRVLGLGFGAVKGLLIASIGFMSFTIIYDALYGTLAPRPDWVRHTRSYPLLSAASEAMSNWVSQSSHEGGLIGAGEEQAKPDGEAIPINEEEP